MDSKKDLYNRKKNKMWFTVKSQISNSKNRKCLINITKCKWRKIFICQTLIIKVKISILFFNKIKINLFTIINKKNSNIITNNKIFYFSIMNTSIINNKIIKSNFNSNTTTFNKLI